MKLIATLLFASLALAQSTVLSAQTARPSAHAATHSAATHSAATHASTAHESGRCVKLPELSPKIPALSAGAPCAHALYTITTQPDVKLDYVAPAEGDLAKELGLEPVSFTLAYIDTHAGSGELALPHKYLTVKYTGYLADGSKFDASDDHPGKEPFTFQAGEHQVVAGWDTGFAGMHVGGKRRLFVPFQLAYGAQGRAPAIPACAQARTRRSRAAGSRSRSCACSHRAQACRAACVRRTQAAISASTPASKDARGSSK